MESTNIFQVLIADNCDSSDLPQAIKLSEESLRSNHPVYKYNRLNHEDIESFIRSNFDSDTLRSFNRLKPFSYKANVARYCLLLVHGGIYADIVIRLIRPLEMPPGKKMICFRDTPGTGLWSVSTSLIAAEQGREEFRLALDLIKANVDELYYGASPLYVSGPGVFGRALAITDKLDDIDVGSFEFFGNIQNPYNLGHIDSNGMLVSLRWKSGSFTELGLSGTNDYVAMWQSRAVYGETSWFFPTSLLHTFSLEVGGSPFVIRSNDNIAFTEEVEGWISFGPYSRLEPGTYTASFRYSDEIVMYGLHMDACGTIDGNPVSLIEKSGHDLDVDGLSVTFSSTKGINEFQVRLRSVGGSRGIISGLELKLIHSV